MDFYFFCYNFYTAFKIYDQSQANNINRNDKKTSIFIEINVNQNQYFLKTKLKTIEIFFKNRNF